MSVVRGRVARAIRLDTFVDITGPDVALVSIKPDALTFDDELTDEQVDAIWWRMTSSSDADETRRRIRADLLGVVTGDGWTVDDVRALLIAAVRDDLCLPE